MSEKLNALKLELETARAVLLPQIEGLHDFARLNIKETTRAKVAEAIIDFERRLERINVALSSLDGLITDNYPAVPTRDVIGEVYSDLSENVDTLKAAFAKFAPIAEATRVELTAGSPVLKL